MGCSKNNCFSSSEQSNNPSDPWDADLPADPGDSDDNSAAKIRRLQPKMKPVQKVVYHLLKESELKKRLRDEGLDAKGDKKTLIQRHQRFAVLWNAQCQAVYFCSFFYIFVENL